MQEPMQWLRGWWQRFDYCFSHNPSSSICDSFWANAIGLFVACGLAMVLFGAWKVFDYRRKARRAAIAEWERNSIDEAGIRETTWRGEAMLAHDVPDDELVAKIRAGVDQRKREIVAQRSSRPDSSSVSGIS